MSCKQYTAALILAALVVASSEAQSATRAGQLLVRPMVGMAVPLTRFKVGSSSGYTFGVAFDYMMSRRFSVGFKTDGARFRIGSYEGINYYGEPHRMYAARKLIQCSAVTRLYLSTEKKANVFVDAGGSFCWTVFRESFRYQDFLMPNRTENKVVPGFELGVGIDSELSPASRLQFGGTFHAIRDPQSSGTLQYWSLWLSVAFQFRPVGS